MTDLLAIAQRPHIRSEKDEERLCDQLIVRIAHHPQPIVRFSQARASGQTLGIYDRRYRCLGICFWWDVKKVDGVLRSEQIIFGEAELVHGNPAGVGTLEDLMAFVDGVRREGILVRRDVACVLGQHLIEKYRPKAKRAKRGKL